MTETEKMVRDMGRFMRSLGDADFSVPEPDRSTSELEYLRTAKQVYVKLLLQKMPKYRVFKSEALIPDMFLDALRRREAELEPGGVKMD
jgi:hypothetical protein